MHYLSGCHTSTFWFGGVYWFIRIHTGFKFNAAELKSSEISVLSAGAPHFVNVALVMGEDCVAPQR